MVQRTACAPHGWAGRAGGLWRFVRHLLGTCPHLVKKLSSPGARAYPEHEDRHTLHYSATGCADTTPVCESSGRRERRPCRVPSLCIAVCPLSLHALSRYPFRFPVQVTRCVFSRCMTAAVKTSSSSGPTSALRAALRSYRVVWMVMISGDFFTVPEKSCIIVFIGEILYPLSLATCFTTQTASAADCSQLSALHTFDTSNWSMPEAGCYAPQDAILHDGNEHASQHT
jgi:hypothetical protein